MDKGTRKIYRNSKFYQRIFFRSDEYEIDSVDGQTITTKTPHCLDNGDRVVLWFKGCDGGVFKTFATVSSGNTSQFSVADNIPDCFEKAFVFCPVSLTGTPTARIYSYPQKKQALLGKITCENGSNVVIISDSVAFEFTNGMTLSAGAAFNAIAIEDWHSVSDGDQYCGSGQTYTHTLVLASNASTSLNASPYFSISGEDRRNEVQSVLEYTQTTFTGNLTYGEIEFEIPVAEINALTRGNHLLQVALSDNLLYHEQLTFEGADNPKDRLDFDDSTHSIELLGGNTIAPGDIVSQLVKVGAAFTIPATGGVTVTLNPSDALANGQSELAVIYRIPGTLSRAGGIYTFSRNFDGTATNIAEGALISILAPEQAQEEPVGLTSSNDFIQAFINRAEVGGWDASNFNLAAHEEIANAAGGAMDSCSTFCLHDGIFTFDPAVANGSGISTWRSADPIGRDIPSFQLQPLYDSWGFNTKPYLTPNGVNIDHLARLDRPSTQNFTSWRFMIFFVLRDVDTTGILEFSSRSAMNADLQHPHGTIAKVVGDSTVANNRYYIKQNVSGSGDWSNFSPEITFGNGSTTRIDYAAHTTSTEIGADLKSTFFAYQASPAQFNTAFSEIFESNKERLVGVESDGIRLRVWSEGRCVAGLRLRPGDLVNATLLRARNYQGIKAICTFNEHSHDSFLSIYNAMAGVYGKRKITKRPIKAFILYGQSWANGVTGVTSPGWTGKNGWLGEIEQNTPPKYAQPVNYPSMQYQLGGNQSWFCQTGQAVSGLYTGEIRPYSWERRTDKAFAAALVGSSPFLAGGSEGVGVGFIAQFSKLNLNATWDGMLIHAGIGGTPIESLDRAEAGPYFKFRQGLGVTLQNYEFLYYRIYQAKEYAESMGRSFTVEGVIWMQQQANTAAQYEQNLLKLYDDLSQDIKSITGQANDPILLSQQINTSSDGVTIGMNSPTGLGKYAYDAIVKNKGNRPIYFADPQYPVSNFIHMYARGYRWQGEQQAKIMNWLITGSVQYEGFRPRTIAISGNSLLITFFVPVPPLQFAANNNNIESLLPNRGFSFESIASSGLTITSVAIEGSTQVRINLSGAPLAGDRIKYATASRYGNLCDSDTTVAVFKDQDWTIGPGAKPLSAEGQLNDLRNWALAFNEVI